MLDLGLKAVVCAFKAWDIRILKKLLKNEKVSLSLFIIEGIPFSLRSKWPQLGYKFFSVLSRG